MSTYARGTEVSKDLPEAAAPLARRLAGTVVDRSVLDALAAGEMDAAVEQLRINLRGRGRRVLKLERDFADHLAGVIITEIAGVAS